MFNYSIQSIMIKPLIFMLGVLSFLLGALAVPNNESFLFCLKKEIDPLVINNASLQADGSYSGAYLGLRWAW